MSEDGKTPTKNNYHLEDWYDACSRRRRKWLSKVTYHFVINIILYTVLMVTPSVFYSVLMDVLMLAMSGTPSATNFITE